MEESLHILLLKKPGDFRVHRLRCIHIQEADQNYQVKYDIAKQFMRHAEKHQVIPEAIHGSRKGRQAVDAAWAIRLAFAMTHLNHEAGAVLFKDLQACYDRVIESFANMSLRAMWVVA